MPNVMRMRDVTATNNDRFLFVRQVERLMDMLRRGEYETTSVISEDSTTDSGRGASEEGDQGYLNSGEWRHEKGRSWGDIGWHFNSLLQYRCQRSRAASNFSVVILLQYVALGGYGEKVWGPLGRRAVSEFPSQNTHIDRDNRFQPMSPKLWCFIILYRFLHDKCGFKYGSINPVNFFKRLFIPFRSKRLTSHKLWVVNLITCTAQNLKTCNIVNIENPDIIDSSVARRGQWEGG